MNTERETFQHSEPWQDELTQLLAQPVHPDESINREGKIVGVGVTPHRSEAQPKVNLTVTLFSRYVSPPEDGRSIGDDEKLGVFLNGLQDADYHIRVAACEMLGQRGGPSARPALEAALHDENRHVRTAATQALAALDVQRVRTEELAGVRLLLWRQVKHLWAPVAEARTNERGQAQFADILGDTPCRFQLLVQPKEAQGPEVEEGGSEVEAADALILPAQEGSAHVFKGMSEEETALPLRLHALPGEGLAAKDIAEKSSTLPQSHRMKVGESDFLYSLYRDNQGQIVLEVCSDAPELQNGWVRISVIHHEAKEKMLDQFIQLKPDATEEMAVETFILSDILDLQDDYDIHVEPLPLPQWEQ